VGAAVQGFGADVAAVAAAKQQQADEAWLANARAQTTLDWHTKIEPGLTSGETGGTAAGGDHANHNECPFF
jgi:uncharacterized protein (UPF0333 family)